MPASFTWLPSPTGGTPVNATNLNKLAVTADLGTAGTPTGDAAIAAFGSVTLVKGTGTADSAAITAAFNSMKVSGHATGTLKLVGTFALNTDLVLDGGYASVTQGANWVSGSTERFVLDASAASLVPAATSACALTVKGFYGGVFRVGFKGGGARRTFADGAITSGSNLFTSAQVANAVVGQYVRIEGAGFLGEVPMQATIVSIAGTTATLSGNATTTVSSATGAISSIALHQENLIDAETDVYANGFAGLVHHIDTQNSTAKYVTQSTLRSLKALSCGQAQGWINVQGGVGALLDVWDDGCVDGSIHDNCADVSIVHWETYNPSTQAVGFHLSQGQDYDAFLSLGDAATEALLKITGGDVKKVRVRAGGRTSVTAGTGTVDGIKLVEVKSIDLEAVTLRCANGIHVKGGGQNSVKIRHFSQTADTVPLYVEAGPSTSKPIIDYDHRARFTGSQSVLLASSLTGGRVNVRGFIDSTINQLAAAGVYAVDCQSTSTILDVAGLVQINKSSNLAGGVNHATPAKLIGVDQARIGNGFSAKGTLWAADGAGALIAVTPGSTGQVPIYQADGSLAAGPVLDVTKLAAASNLSDLANAATARTNLGLATVAATGSYNDLSNKPAASTPLGYLDPTMFGLKAFNHAPGMNTTNKLPVSGKVYLIGIPVPAAITVNTINVFAWTAGATLTAGQNFLGLYDTSGNLLGTTADQSTAFASTGPKSAALGGSVNLTGGTGIQCYLAILATGTTVPGFAALPGGFGALTNFGMASGTMTQGQDGTTRTSLPATITLTGVTQAQTVLWGALS